MTIGYVGNAGQNGMMEEEQCSALAANAAAQAALWSTPVTSRAAEQHTLTARDLDLGESLLTLAASAYAFPKQGVVPVASVLAAPPRWQPGNHSIGTSGHCTV